MSDAAWFGVAIVVLLLAIYLGHRRWAGYPAGAAEKFVLISTALGGIIGAPFWWLDLPASFAWDLPPVGARLLAAAALAFGVAGLLLLERPSEERSRLYALQTALYLVPLAIAAVALHLNRFDFGKPVTYGFFAVVIVLSIGSLRLLLQPTASAGALAPTNGVTRGWLLFSGLLLSAWGVALFAAPATGLPLVFNWAQDPLTSRLIAAMLIVIGAGNLRSLRSRGLARMALVFASVYGVAGCAACLMNLAAQKPVPPLYAAALGIMGVVSLLLLPSVPGRPDAAGEAA